MEIEPLVLLFIIIFAFFLGRLTKGLKIRAGIKQASIGSEEPEGPSNVPSQSSQPKLKTEQSAKIVIPTVMDYLMSSMMTIAFLWLINTSLTIFNSQLPFIQYPLYFLAEIFASYPLTSKSPNDLSIGLKAGAGATIITLLLYADSWDFWNALLLTVSLLSAGLFSSYLAKKKILKKKI